MIKRDSGKRSESMETASRRERKHRVRELSSAALFYTPNFTGLLAISDD